MESSAPQLPDASTLAALVSNVTETMCGTSFVVDDPYARGESLCARMFVLPLLGGRRISIVLGCDAQAAHGLASALFGVGADQLDANMPDEAICELLNMIAGQITGRFRLEVALGLPRRTTIGEVCGAGGLRFEDAALLTSRGRLNLRLWIFEHEEGTASSSAPPGRLRSLLNSLLGSG